MPRRNITQKKDDMMSYKLKSSLAACALAGIGLSLSAQEIVWYSNSTEAAQTSKDWFDTAIWNSGTVPQSSMDVNACVNVFNDLEISSGSVDIYTLWLKTGGKSLTLGQGASLSLTQNLILDGSVTTDDAYIKVSEGATLRIEGQTNLTSSGGGIASIINDSGTVIINQTGSGNYVNNAGTMNISNISGGSYTIDGGSLTTSNIANSQFEIADGTVNSNGNIGSGSTITMHGGQFNQANTVWDGVSVNLFGTSKFKMAHNTQFTTSTVTLAGGQLYNSSGENLTVNGTKIIFGAVDEESGVFTAASARSIEMGNKLNVWDGGANPTTFTFNLGKENLITSSEIADLKANAFVYSAFEIEFHQSASGDGMNRVSVELNFDNIDFSGLDGDYYVSLFAMEMDFHRDVEPLFSYTDAEGLVKEIVYGDTYVYNDNLTFEVTHDTSTYAYYLTLHVSGVPVPEPATCAAIIGALALGLALIRRRK